MDFMVLQIRMIRKFAIDRYFLLIKSIFSYFICAACDKMLSMIVNRILEMWIVDSKILWSDWAVTSFDSLPFDGTVLHVVQFSYPHTVYIRSHRKWIDEVDIDADVEYVFPFSFFFISVILSECLSAFCSNHLVRIEKSRKKRTSNANVETGYRIWKRVENKSKRTMNRFLSCCYFWSPWT